MNDEDRTPTTPYTLSTSRPRTLRERFGTRRVLVIAGLLLGFVLVAWLLTPKQGTRPQAGGRFFAQAGPMPVLASSARPGDMPITLIGLGTVTPLATVTVQSQISGQIQRISFKEGQKVKRGYPLFLIDPRPYQVALEQAEGALMRDRALLANAHVDLDRYQTLFAEDSI